MCGPGHMAVEERGSGREGERKNGGGHWGGDGRGAGTWAKGGRAAAISHTTQPSDHTSAGAAGPAFRMACAARSPAARRISDGWCAVAATLRAVW